MIKETTLIQLHTAIEDYINTLDLLDKSLETPSKVCLIAPDEKSESYITLGITDQEDRDTVSDLLVLMKEKKYYDIICLLKEATSQLTAS